MLNTKYVVLLHFSLQLSFCSWWQLLIVSKKFVDKTSLLGCAKFVRNIFSFAFHCTPENKSMILVAIKDTYMSKGWGFRMVTFP